MKKTGKSDKPVNKFATPKDDQKENVHKGGSFTLKDISAFFLSRDALLVYSLLLFIFNLFLLISFTSYFSTWNEDDVWLQAHGKSSATQNITPANTGGKIGAFLAFLLMKQSFGAGSFVLLAYLFILSLQGMNLIKLDLIKFLIFSIILSIYLSTLMAFIFPNQPVFGGILGKNIAIWLLNLFGKLFSGIILLLLAVFISFILAPQHVTKIYKKYFSHKDTISTIDNEEQEQTVAEPGPPEDVEKGNDSVESLTTSLTGQENVSQTLKPTSEIELDLHDDKSALKQGEESVQSFLDTGEQSRTNVQQENISQQEKTVIPLELDDQMVPTSLQKANLHSDQEEFNFSELVENPYDSLRHYKFPPLDLLTYHGRGDAGVTREELEENKNKIVETLRNYEIDIVKIKATIGPTVTMYEIVPAPGVRISKIRNLEDDIALSLSALGIRIIAPIPGKGTIGIEVPNQKREIVSLRSMLETDKFQNHTGELPFVLGKTITNEPFVSDLAKLPHLLIAGATGQGKSVGINIIISSLLYKKHPGQLKFIFIDPKKVELAPYNKLENHFLAKLPDEVEPIVTDVSKVVKTLTSVTKLMDWRYDLLKDAGVKNIVEYNQKYLQKRLNPQKGHHFMPYIVVVIDEFADLIMTAGKEVELPVARIAQLARAVGIHLIVATQRPSVDVITGKIKANFPARIAFRVSSKVDSRTILDYNGAEQLIGMGDMLYLHGNDFLRIQCAFVSTEEIDKIVDFIGNQVGYPHPYYLPEVADEDQGENLQDVTNLDRLFADAARIVVSTQQGSTSLLQTKLNIGFARARRIIEQLEQTGIVGPPQGSKPRDVLIKDLNHLEQFLSNLQNKNTVL